MSKRRERFQWKTSRGSTVTNRKITGKLSKGGKESLDPGQFLKAADTVSGKRCLDVEKLQKFKVTKRDANNAKPC